MRLWGWCLLLGISFSTPVVRAESAADSAQLRERLNKLLYWALSDELKLSPQQEKQMIALVEGIQQKREVAFQQREGALAELRKLGKESPAKVVEGPLQRFQKSSEDLVSLEAEEYRQLLPLLGPPTLARFYVVRDDLAHKVREALKSDKK